MLTWPQNSENPISVLREEDAAAPLLPLQGSVILKRRGGDFNAMMA